MKEYVMFFISNKMIVTISHEMKFMYLNQVMIYHFFIGLDCLVIRCLEWQDKTVQARSLQFYIFHCLRSFSNTAVQETQNFITSVVVGKDVVPRIGLHQFEALRQDLINMIKSSSNPKVGISFQWLSVRLQYLQCISTGDTAVLH